MSLLREFDNDFHKAGILPYYFDNRKQPVFGFMVSSNSAFGGAKPMLAKGHVDSGESIEGAALREGHEELGLRHDNIIPGSLRKGWSGQLSGLTDTYTLHVYTCEIDDRDNLDTPHYETERVEWLTAEEFMQKGRKSQSHIVWDIAKHIVRPT